MEQIALLIAATLNAGTVLAFAALGLLINERAGIVNLGAEGLMLVAAITGFATAANTGSDALAFVAGMAAGAALSAVFGWLVIWLNTNQYATGLALALFGGGFSAFVGIGYTQSKLSERAHYDIPVLAEFFGRRMALDLEMDGWPGFSAEAMARLQDYDWPGNVRELRNVVERAVYRWAGLEGPIEDIQFDPFESPWRPLTGQGANREAAPASIPAADGAQPFPAVPTAYNPGDCADFRLAIADYEKAILTAALERCRWNQRAAATALSLTYDQLRHAMRRHELQGG